jgi:hypothetical protein
VAYCRGTLAGVAAERFTKLSKSILLSTVWLESLETKVVWITMLALADADGYVGASVPGLARAAGVSDGAAEVALAKFLAPDPHSRTKDHEGRRIAVAERGWLLLNYRKVRDTRDQDVRREQTKQAVRRHRARAKQLSKHARDVQAFDEAAGNVAPVSVYEGLEE